MASDDDAALAAKKEVPSVPKAWGRVPAAADMDGAGAPVLGRPEYWPALPGSTVPAAAAAKPTPASDPSKPTGAPISTGSPGASSSGAHGDRAAPTTPERSAAAPEPSPIHAPDHRSRSTQERRDGAAAPEPLPTQAPNHRSNAGARGRQNGRYVPPHAYGRGGGGHNGGGSRRPVGGANGRGNSNVNVHVHVNGNGYGYGHGRGGWHGQEHRGGFNGQHRGRDHQHDHRGPGHRPLGPQMSYAAEPPPHPYPMHPPPPQLPPAPAPFMGMVAPPMPYCDPYYYGLPAGYGPYGYPAADFATGYYFPPAPEALQFWPYQPLPMQHMMAPHLDQKLVPQQPAQEEQPSQEQHEAHLEEQHQEEAHSNDEQQEVPLSPEQTRKEVREQIEYYFSENNLIKDMHLRKNMDEQGWVPLTLVAGFPLIRFRTIDMELILDAVIASTEVEVQDGKIRKCEGWERYTIPTNN